MIFRSVLFSAPPLLWQDVGIDSRIAAGNFDGTAGFFVKFAGAYASDDGIGVAGFAEGFEGAEEQGFPDVETAGGFRDAGRTEKPALRDIIASEAEDFLVLCGDEAGGGLPGERDFDLADPLSRKVRAGERGDGVFFERARAAQGDAVFRSFPISFRWIWQVVEPHEHINHAEK